MLSQKKYPIQSDLEISLLNLPDQVADALKRWRMASLARERLEASLYLKFSAEPLKQTADALKARVRDDSQRYEAVLKELTAESDYVRLDNRLMSFKRLASLRGGF